MRGYALPLLVLAALLMPPLSAQPKPAEKAVVKPIYIEARGEPGARRPAISDDGSTIVFSLWGDIWRWNAGATRATALTHHRAYDSLPELSPDGQTVAFSSDRNGNNDVYLIDIGGGPALRLTFHSSGDYVGGYSSDGTELYFTSTRGDLHSLWRIPVAGGTPTQVLDDRFIPGDISIRDGTIAYTSGTTKRYRRGYQGSANEDLYLLRTGHEFPTRMTTFEGNDRSVLILPRGRILFAREVDRHFDLYLKESPVEQARKVLGFDDVGAEELSLSANGAWLVFQRMHYLYRIKVASLLAGEEPELVKLIVRQDTFRTQTEQRIFTSGLTDPHLSGDGRTIAFVLRGAIWTVPAGGGDAVKITRSGHGDTQPKLSPDGKLIAFMSRRAGNHDLWLVKSTGGEPWQITTHAKDDFFHNWSPDGRALVFCSERSGNRDIWLKPIDGGAAVQLTTHSKSDDDPSFSPDGKTIAFDSGRRGSADIFLMDSDGKNQRFLTGGPDTEQVPTFSRDGRIVYFERYVSGAQKTSLFAMRTSGGAAMLLAPDASSISETPDGRTVLFEGTRRGVTQLLRLPAPRQILAAQVVPVIARETVDLASERVALFDEAWNKINTRFYDPKFHGADWPAIRQRYRPLVRRSRCIEECYYYIWMAIGELSSSHLGVRGRSSGSGRASTAYLGATLVPENLKGGRQVLRVTKLQKDGPLDKLWVRDGDYIVAIGGKAIKRRDNAYARLDLYKTGAKVTLHISETGSPKDARKIEVKPDDYRRASSRRYGTVFIERMVTTLVKSDMRVLYIHLTAMNETNLRAFRDLLASKEAAKASGLIIDCRGNRGGLSYMEIMELLVAKPYLYIKPRTRVRWKQPRLFWDRPVTVLCDERSNSGGECFPWAIKFTGRGKVVGERTPGNVIGTAWDRLADGTLFGVPTSGYFSMDDKRNLEGNGVRPDVHVPMTARDRIERTDPQLDAAIETILKELPNVAKKNGK